MNKDQLLEKLSIKSSTTPITLHQITSINGAPARALRFAWLGPAGMGDYEFRPVKDAETHEAVINAIKEGTIVTSGHYNYDHATGIKGEKLVLKP